MLTQPRPIRLKGRSYLALTLTPERPFADWLERLDDLAARSAGFFLRRPIVLDLNGLTIDRAELRDLVAQLATRQVRVMGIDGASPSMLGADLPPAMPDGKPTSDFAQPVATPAETTEPTEPAAALEPAPAPATAETPRPVPSIIVTEPVRSGQSLVFLEGDITVIGSVASGAEIIAGGSVHVYGTLRGRAMAGTMGNASARIFCRKLEAELIAVDGYYKSAEDLEPEFRGKAVQIWLDGEEFKVAALA